MKMNFYNLLFTGFGRWRIDFFWRMFGFCLFLSARFTLNNAATFEHLRSAGVPLSLMLISSLLLLLYGGRLIVLLLTILSTWLYILPILFLDMEAQISEEYLLILILPVMAVVFIIITFIQGKGDHENINTNMDKAFVSLCRLTVTGALFWAAFHKVNHDFFNSDVSCATGIMSLLKENWLFPFPNWLINILPGVGVVFELLIPILLWVNPRVGIIFGMLVLGLLAHVGPIPFTFIIIILIWMFLREEDGALIRESLKESWKKNKYPLAVLFLILSTVSINNYIGEKKWQLYMLFEVVWFGLMYVMMILIEKTWSQSLNLRTWQSAFPGIERRSSWPKNKISKWIIVIYMVMFMINGFTPYLGVKYRMSFAMLSNLRIDQYRWNSLIVPEAVKLVKKQAYIHVTQVDMNETNFARIKKMSKWYDRTIYVGYFTPMSLKHRLDIYLRSGIDVNLVIEHNGISRKFNDAARNAQLWQWLWNIPDSKMFIKYLSDGPQECYH